MFPVRRNAGCFALRGSRTRAEAAVKPTSRSAGDRVFLAGLACSGFGEAELGIYFLGNVCFEHGPCPCTKENCPYQIKSYLS